MLASKFRSLEEFLGSHPLSVDALVDDGWGEKFPVRGREIRASVLFADISGYSGRTRHLTSTETLIFTNDFFAWIAGEALRGCPGIVDKYIGDEIMVVFSEEFGSEDSFVDALRTARFMLERDELAFEPHVGVASGIVTVGYVGTVLKYSCSVYGAPVTIASRCAGSARSTEIPPKFRKRIAFPAHEWSNLDIDVLFPPIVYECEGKSKAMPQGWSVLDPREVEMKNLGPIAIREVVSGIAHMPSQGPEERAKETLREIAAKGGYHPKLRRGDDESP